MTTKIDINEDSVYVGGREYVPKSKLDEVVIRNLGPVRIVVADRGWVFVGACDDNDDGTVTICNARNIRRWGTTTGLGELINGPLPETKHDKYGTVRCSPIVQINVLKGW
jgi:hypothetical protein